MNTAQLECFVAVADTLSFARAAERLHVTQPAVTHQIRSLEAELGASLFQRSTRRVRLTDEGLLFLSDAESILDTERRARGRFRFRSKEVPVRLGLGCRNFGHFAAMGPVLAALAARFDGLRPDLAMVPHDHLHALLQDGEMDVVLDFEGAGRRGETFSALVRTEVVCVCRADDELAARSRVLPSELSGRRLALVKPQREPAALREVERQLLGDGDFTRHYLCDSVEAAVTLVQAGLAVSVQPQLSVPPGPEFAHVAVAGCEPLRFGAYTLGEPAGEVAAAFVELARAHFSPA